MARKRYTPAQQAEAVAIARSAGAKYAAEHLGMDVRTVRSYLDAAGDPPELDGTASGWKQLIDLAQSQVVAALTSGKVRPKDAAVIAAIAERNLRTIEDRAERKRADAEPENHWTAFDEWCDRTYPTKQLAEIAKEVPSYVIRYGLRAGIFENNYEDQSNNTETEFGHWCEWASGLVEAVGDLETFEAEFTRWYAEDNAYQRALDRRMQAIAWGGDTGTGHTAPPMMQYPAAREIAVLISTDLVPIPPAWASAVTEMIADPTEPPADLLDDDALDAVIGELEHRRHVRGGRDLEDDDL